MLWLQCSVYWMSCHKLRYTLSQQDAAERKMEWNQQETVTYKPLYFLLRPWLTFSFPWLLITPPTFLSLRLPCDSSWLLRWDFLFSLAKIHLLMSSKAHTFWVLAYMLAVSSLLTRNILIYALDYTCMAGNIWGRSLNSSPQCSVSSWSILTHSWSPPLFLWKSHWSMSYSWLPNMIFTFHTRNLLTAAEIHTK